MLISKYLKKFLKIGKNLLHYAKLRSNIGSSKFILGELSCIFYIFFFVNYNKYLIFF